MSKELHVGGLTTFSTVDYPDKLSAVVHCQGCTGNCRYCHNPGLLPRHAAGLPWSTVLSELASRLGYIDAVVFSGGEPLLQNAVHEAIVRVKAMGFLAGMHTAGFLPRRLEAVLPFLDWVGLDIKTAPTRYAEVGCSEKYGPKVWESVKLLIDGCTDYELRTTVHPEIVPPRLMAMIVKDLLEMGAKNIVIQLYRPGNILGEDLSPICEADRASYALITDLYPETSIR